MALHVVSIDLDWSTQRIDAAFDAMDRMAARIERCEHRWTLAPVAGYECTDCHVFVLEREQG